MIYEKLKDIFKKARKDLLYPPISNFTLDNDINICEFDFSGRWKIIIDRKIAHDLSLVALLGVFHHQLNHWAKHPYDLKTIILENYYLGDMPNKTEIRNLYDDAVANLDLVINKELTEIATTYKEIPPKSKADNVLRAFYKEVTGLDFGDSLSDPDLQEYVKALLEIDFLNTNRMFLKLNLKKFAHLIKDLMDKDPAIPFGFFSLNQFTLQEIKRSLRNIAKEFSLDEYRKIVNNVSEEIKGSIAPANQSFLEELKRPDIGWYETKALDYTIYIEAIYKDGSLYPDEIKDFEIEESIDHYSPVESYGMFLPGIAKKYTLRGFEGNAYAIPSDAVVIIDSSGSMIQPDINLSYAVLSAFCLAKNYIENGSKVGVVNFSDRNISLLPTQEKRKVFETLIAYQGGGTTLHIGDFLNYIDSANLKKRKDVDYIIITDAGIHNLDPLLSYLPEMSGRITFLWIKTGESFKDKFQKIKESLPSNVTFVEIDNIKDMAKIAVGKAFKEYAESY
ncbi:MAG: VWA domain-containing protein [Thermodesulfovibrionales bacterium]|nr:VWA domain-containing protein [Thermodesulfovibrionales bacterium]